MAPAPPTKPAAVSGTSNKVHPADSSGGGVKAADAGGGAKAVDDGGGAKAADAGGGAKAADTGGETKNGTDASNPDLLTIRKNKKDGDSTGGDSTHKGAEGRRKSVAQRNKEKMKNGCQQCCGKIMAVFSHDAIYGSFVGPHPVSFLFCCSLFKKKCPCAKKCSRPFCVASIATKIMNFIMFGIVTILAGFFVIPWPNINALTLNSTNIARAYPCTGDKMIKYKDANGGCLNHAGYFMAYRVFLAYATFMFTNCIIMIRVSNTQDDPYRSRIHHGFWLYKYIYLVILLFIYFFMVDGNRDKEGVFEFATSVIGNIAHFLFSLIEITFIMDIVELWVYENRSNGGKWSNFIYWANTCLIYLVGVIVYVKIWVDYSSERVFIDKDGKIDEWPPWPEDNCIEGKKKDPDWKHTGLILGSTATMMLLIIVMAFKKLFGIDYRLPYTGWLQIGVMILFNVSYLWSALTNSSNIHSRPHCNGGLDFVSNPKQNDLREGVRTGSYDQYLATSGLFHGIICVSALIYFTFIHGPRSATAPLSLLYYFIFPIVDRIPVYPDEDDQESGVPLGYLQAIEQSKVWDDEQVVVAQTWSHFYFMMLIGSLSLMMSMTNFTNPWAADHYNSSNVAFYSKFGTALVATLLYIVVLINQCRSIHDYGLSGEAKRKRSVKEVLTFEFEHSEKDVEDGGMEGEEGRVKQTFKFFMPGTGEKQEEDVKLDGYKDKDAGEDGGGKSK